MTLQKPRPDASMDLLRMLREEAVDPEYARVGAGGPRRGRPVLLLAAAIAAGLLFGMAGGTTMRAAPAASRERDDLIARITAAETTQDELRARQVELSRTNAELGAAQAGLDATGQQRLDRLDVLTGMGAVTGPGVRLTLDDGPDATVGGSRLVDDDLRMVTNGLWAAGAEAVAINGHRLSSRTPIRNAGDAITVDYRSLSRPYVVEAIGDPDTLQRGFAASQGGAWAAGLAEHYGVVWSISAQQYLELGADPGLGVQHAQREG